MANTTIIIITPEYLRENSIIEDNVESEVLLNSIVTAQDKSIWVTLGSDLYNRVLSDISGNTLTGVYETLVNDFCVPYLTHAALLEATPFIMFKYTNKGIEVKDWDQGTPIDQDTLEFLMNNIRNTMYFYEQRLKDHLKFNNDLYSELDTNTDDELKPETGTQSGGIFIPGRSNDCDCDIRYLV